MQLYENTTLIGESIPATKTPLPNPTISKTQDTPFNIKHHSRHILFCGTNVIQTRYCGNQRVRAVVVRTGTKECFYFFIFIKFDSILYIILQFQVLK